MTIAELGLMPHNLATMPIDPNHNLILQRTRFFVNRRSWIWLLLVSVLFPIGQLAAQDNESSKSKEKAVSETAETAIADANPPQKAPITPEKRRVIVIATLMMAGVVTVLLLLFLWMLWWSRRTRKLLREPLPAAGPGDELWYLKAKQDVQKAAERLATKRETPPPGSRPES